MVVARANLGGGCWDRLRKPKERQSKVDESILVALNLTVANGELQLECTVSHTPWDWWKLTLYSSRHTNPTTRDVVVAMAGMIFPAMPLLCT